MLNPKEIQISPKIQSIYFEVSGLLLFFFRYYTLASPSMVIKSSYPSLGLELF
jgi:hypothetical protein